ncbi:MAG: hypothetical protein PHE83_12880 [Opitutaceae bacterium]|nr:hypothetical protein [Opitutaceae bacterium]
MNPLPVVGAQSRCARPRGRDKIAPLPRAGFWHLASVLCILASGLLLPASGRGAPLDLGRNLAYVRLHRLPDDASTLGAAWNAPALIIDLRYPAADTAHTLTANLAPRPRTAPLFVLTGPDTPADLFAALRARAPALITLGLPAATLTPDIILVIKPETDRRAYDALDAGTPFESLISEKTSKPRFDEAVLAHEYARDTEDAGPGGPDAADANDVPSAAGAPSPMSATAAAPAAPPPLIDTVLQRAVQLHRALLALGKLPPG